MSLDVYLNSPIEIEQKCICQCCDNEYIKKEFTTYYHANITHNLGNMAEAAGIYKALWRPEEIGIMKASELIDILEKGYAELKQRPEEFMKRNAPNGYGTYEGLCSFVANYLAACKEFPDARIEVSR